MDAFLILLAILASVVLLFRYAVPLAKPKLSQSERLSDAALKNRLVMLAKRCAKTKRGFGLYYRHIDLDKILKRIEKKIDGGNAPDDWEQALYEDRGSLAHAYDGSLAAMRLGHTLGHVDGYPRLYLLCAEIAESRQGDLTGGTLDLSLDTFQAYAPLTDGELALFPKMLAFCLCALVCDTAHRAFKRERSYDKGATDGKLGKVDLDGLTDVDYVDGLFDASDEKDKDSIARLFENNGVDREQCEYVRAVFLAQAYGIVKAVKRSLRAVREYEQKHDAKNTAAKNKAPSRRLVLFLNIAPIALTVTFAVLTCIFVPYEYAAVCVSAAILFYGCFRLPLLLLAPAERPFDVFSRIWRVSRRNSAANKKTEKTASTAIADVNSEIAYIGCEPIYSSRNVFGGRVRAVCDNRGEIRLNRSGSRGMSDRMKIAFEHGGKTIELSACDGAYDGHKYTYRAFSSLAEFAVDIVTPIDCDCCCCMISVINRSPENISVKIIGALTIACDGIVPTPQTTSKRIAVSDGTNAAALTLGDDAAYCMTVDRQADAAFYRLSAIRQTEISGFCRCDLMLSAAYGSSPTETDRMLDRLYCDGYFDYATDCLKAFSRTENIGRDEPPDGFCMLSERSAQAKYAAPSDRCEPDGYLLDGGFALSRESAIYDDGHVCNTLCNGKIGVRLYQDSVGAIFNVHPYRSLTDENPTYKDTDKACFMIGENDVMWSPIGGQYGHGHTRVEHRLGHTTYFCAYNGCVCETECRLSNDSGVVFFDLTIENRVPFARSLDVMFSVLTAEKYSVKRYGNGLSAKRADDRASFAMLCSQHVDDMTEYKEGYFSHGRIVNVRGFGNNGSTPAPTLSARVKLEPYDGARIVFCIATDDEPSIQAASIANADAASRAEREMRRRAERVKLLSDDNALNVMHMRAQYIAYVGALMSEAFTVPQACAVLGCVKFVDRKFVRRKLLELLSKQAANGTFDARTDGVWVAYAVADYAEFSCDYGIFDELVAYAPDVLRGKRESQTATVKDHVLRAVDMSALSCNADDAFRVVYFKMLADVLRYYKALCSSDNVRAKKYQTALNRAISEHALSARRFIDNEAYNYTDDVLLRSAALYSCGKYDKAYTALKTMTERMVAHPDIYGDENEAVKAAVYYTLVTEKLLGLKIRGNRVKIDPHISSNTPHLEFSLRSDTEGSVHVTVDGTADGGDWRIRADKISYALNSIILGEKDNGKITLYREALTDD